MMKTLIAFILYSCSSFACREVYESKWFKPESFAVQNSEWISVVEITSVETKNSKNTYHYKLVRNLKGTNPKDGIIGPFPIEQKANDIVNPTWKDKGCVQRVYLEASKQYILFSMIGNPSSIQTSNAENENRIKNMIENSQVDKDKTK